MNVIRIYAHGIREASRRPTMIALLWLVNIVLAAPAGLLFSGALGAAVGMSTAPLDQEAVFEFLTGSTVAIRGVTTAAFAAIVLSAFVSIFTFGGILHTLVRRGNAEKPGQAFFGGGARYYGRFLRLTLYSTVLWVPALALFVPVHVLATAVMKDATNEQMGVFLTVFRVALALFLVLFVKMIMDYARVRIVREDTKRVYDSLIWAVRFVFGRLGGTLLLYYLLAVTGWAMLAAYLVLNRFFAGSAPAMIAAAFLLTQLFVAGRGWLKIAFQAAQLEYISPARGPKGVRGGLGEAFGDRRVIEDHAGDILRPGSRPDGQGGEVDDLRGVGADDVGADELP